MTMLDDKLNQFIASIAVTFVVIASAVLIELLVARGRRFAHTIVFNTTYAVAMTALAVAMQPIVDAKGEFLAAHVGLAPLDPRPWLGSARVGGCPDAVRGLHLLLGNPAQHRFAVLWAMHSFHHSDDDLNATAAYRHYWLDKPFFALIAYVPLGLIFRIPPSVAAAYGLLFTFFSIFPHMNLRVELGPLTRVFTGPQVHRIHHSIHPHHFNTNFAGAFPLWDLLLGRYRGPERGEFPPTGVPAMPSTQDRSRTSVARVPTTPRSRRVDNVGVGKLTPPALRGLRTSSIGTWHRTGTRAALSVSILAFREAASNYDDVSPHGYGCGLAPAAFLESGPPRRGRLSPDRPVTHQEMPSLRFHRNLPGGTTCRPTGARFLARTRFCRRGYSVRA